MEFLRSGGSMLISIAPLKSELSCVSFIIHHRERSAALGGLFVYCRRHTSHLVMLLWPIYWVTHNDDSFEWGVEPVSGAKRDRCSRPSGIRNIHGRQWHCMKPWPYRRGLIPGVCNEAFFCDNYSLFEKQPLDPRRDLTCSHETPSTSEARAAYHWHVQ